VAVSALCKVDCQEKIIYFELPQQPTLMYRGIKPINSIPMILVIKAEKLVQHGCEAYLAFVTMRGGHKIGLAKIPTVCDFLDVFPDDLPGLPPQ